jgi:hypothetical protein
VKLLKAGPEKFVFAVAPSEKRLLFTLLESYPMIPPAHQPVSRGEPRPDDQALLDSALAVHRAGNRKALDRLMKSPSRFRRNAEGWSFSLKRGEMEWLLQVLNDIRVGSWVRLGSPEPLQTALPAMTPENIPLFWLMEVAGEFQMRILQALSGTPDLDDNAPRT